MAVLAYTAALIPVDATPADFVIKVVKAKN